MGRKIWKHRYYIILLVISCVCAGLLIVRGIGQENMESSTLHDLNKGWYYWENNQKIPVTLPAKIEYHDSDYLELFYDGAAVCSGYLKTEGVSYDTRIYADGALIYQFDDKGMKRNDTVLDNIICLAQLPEDMSGSQISMIFHNEKDGIYSIHEVMAGSWEAVLSELFRSNAYTLFMTFSMIVLGILSLGLAIIMYRVRMDGRKPVYMALFLLTCGFWCLTDSSFVQLLAGYGRGIVYINFYLFMLILVPMVHYLRSLGDMEKYRFFSVFIYLGYLNIIVQSVLVYSDQFTFFEMLPVTHLLYVAGVLVSVVLSVYEYKKSADKELGVCVRAFAAEGIVGIITIFSYALRFNAYQNLFQIGILLFVFILLYSLGREIVESMQYRTEVEVYRRMAEEDKLTGLKNRRAFDIMIQSMEENRRRCRDALMIFADLNGLKGVNDNYGHTDGDELIAAAAHCIDKAYSELGDCYRIGGDEFCVIIFDPAYSETVMQERLEKEIDGYNALNPGKHPLSIAYGSSYLRDVDGKEKSVSSWREEADQKMYLDKRRKKADRR